MSIVYRHKINNRKKRNQTYQHLAIHSLENCMNIVWLKPLVEILCFGGCVIVGNGFS